MVLENIKNLRSDNWHADFILLYFFYAFLFPERRKKVIKHSTKQLSRVTIHSNLLELMPCNFEAIEIMLIFI